MNIQYLRQKLYIIILKDTNTEKKVYINLLLLEMHINSHMGQTIPLVGEHGGGGGLWFMLNMLTKYFI